MARGGGTRFSTSFSGKIAALDRTTHGSLPDSGPPPEVRELVVFDSLGWDNRQVGAYPWYAWGGWFSVRAARRTQTAAG